MYSGVKKVVDSFTLPFTLHFRRHSDGNMGVLPVSASQYVSDMFSIEGQVVVMTGTKQAPVRASFEFELIKNHLQVLPGAWDWRLLKGWCKPGHTSLASMWERILRQHSMAWPSTALRSSTTSKHVILSLCHQYGRTQSFFLRRSDVSDPDAITSTVGQIVQDFGRIDAW